MLSRILYNSCFAVFDDEGVNTHPHNVTFYDEDEQLYYEFIASDKGLKMIEAGLTIDECIVVSPQVIFTGTWAEDDGPLMV